ncbi:anaerobic ribonucleoside-triphosphate reductase [Vibrio phage phiKT1024]|nr:anaerobic ribonucleoside-triphosphate reductase [Vibrio phage phiKT1024]
MIYNQELINSQTQFINDYIKSSNAAEGSKFDANANIDSKNIATLETELWKAGNIAVNRELLRREIEQKFSKELSQEYIRQLESHEIYTHDETSLKPYCVSVTMYPFLLDGVTKLGGESKAPQHLASFCGSFINFVFATASQFAGAVATVEWLMYFDHFARKDYGDNYLETHESLIKESLQHVVYSINQPAAARGYQSVFWNISIYDKPYFEAMFGDFVFPDMDKPQYESLDRLQKYFMKWFNKEREQAILTYPVVTAACLTNGEELVDSQFEDFITEELSEGNSFFIFMSENAHALSSCCRLKNDVSDQMNDFSYSLGAGGVATGSINVITMNLNRLIQNASKDGKDIFEAVQEQTRKIHQYQIGYRSLIQNYKDAGLLPVYDAGFISLDKQFLTIGINGLVEGAEFLGMKIDANEEYMSFSSQLLKTISDENKKASNETGFKFNTEFVPAENLGVKNAKWDRKDGYFVPRDCYNSYMYLVEDDSVSITEKFELHGKEFMQYLDGGSAYHCNLEEYPNQEGFRKLIKVAAQVGCDYWCTNVKITICNSCENIDKRTLQKCPKCGSKDIDHGTRVIGYLKRVSAFSEARQTEHQLRHYNLVK